MTDYNMGCLGSILMFNEADAYCISCHLRTQCKELVEQNRGEIQAALGRPVFGDKAWLGKARAAKRKHEAARKQSGDVVVEEKPKPAKKAAPKPVRTAPPNKMTPAEAMQHGEHPVKVVKALDAWVRHGVDPSLIEEGRNPFEYVGGQVLAQVFTEAVLRLGGRPSKRAVREEMIKIQHETGGTIWSDGTVSSNVNIISGAFFACGYDLLEEKA